MKSNVQVMREAARHLLCVIDEMGFKPWCADDPLAIACDKLDAALALPLRNCDVGTAEEQTKIFDGFCDMQCLSGCSNCPCNTKPMITDIECFSNWSQMPYKEGDNYGR